MPREPLEPPSEPPARRGLSLGFKFSLVLILALSGLVAGVGAALYHLSLGQLETEIDKRGATLATALSALGGAHWNAVLAAPKPEESLRGYLNQPATRRELFNIYLLNAEGGAFASAVPTGDVRIDGGTVGPYAGDADIQVRRDAVLLEIKTGKSTPVRGFRIPLRPPAALSSGSWVHSLLLILNAEEIEKTRGALRGSVVMTTLLAIGLGAGVAFWLASFVTNPLKLLMKDIRTVSAGNLDHHTRSHSTDEIGELAETFNHLTVMMRVARQVEMERQAIEHDLTLAREIQANLLPKRIPKIRGIDIQAFYRAAKEVGGDYYDLIPLTARHLGVAVGDVAGKGVQGSMVMAMTRAVIRSVAPGSSSAANTLIRTNHVLARDLKPGSFVTLIFLVMDVVGRTLTVGRAGHNPLLIHHGETGRSEFLNPGGIALGFDKGPIFEKTLKEATVPLAKGDVVVAYTDGVVESMNEEREQYGSERFQRLVAAHAHGSAEALMKALVADLDRHQGSAPQHDDITVVVLKIL